MRPLADIGAELDGAVNGEQSLAPSRLLALGEETLENWVSVRGETPTNETREGFRLLALHRQGANGNPSFNACRETCRELVYHYNLITMLPDEAQDGHQLKMMALVANHLFLFVSGKLESRDLGDFCCSSKPLRAAQ